MNMKRISISLTRGDGNEVKVKRKKGRMPDAETRFI
jgi:hypothetical protein